mmetsp:Transcript_46782/g.111277  ORF Transcript_46782/g.111277 Transcript_46782/m.111277 type:complete len:545 (-) Transcript_46782:53-1687(-)
MAVGGIELPHIDWTWISQQLSDQRTKKIVMGAAAAAGVGYSLWSWRLTRSRRLIRPYFIPEGSVADDVLDPQGELTRIVEWIQDAAIRPLDAKLPGKPFELDLLAFPFTPMVLVVGNHSAGKSTFINQLLGLPVQETGVAPTDDGFTVLERSETTSEWEDGPTLLACAENTPFKELQRFGQAFSGHLRRKRLSLPPETSMPFGLQVVDTPGMIDMPVKAPVSEGYVGGRGYNFVEAVRWFAKRADLILLLFDPDRPGTTREAIEVLTKSLAGLDHKFLIVLNKVDQLDNSVDFARAYGTLGWALSKVIPRTDIPLIYTMYNETPLKQNAKEHEHLPLEAFRKKREEVVAEVLRAKARHWDNVITSTEDTLRQMEMVTTITGVVRRRMRWRLWKARVWGSMVFVLPGIMALELWRGGTSLGRKSAVAVGTVYSLTCVSAFVALWEYGKHFQHLEAAQLDDMFEEAYHSYMIHADSEDLRTRWAAVRPRVMTIIRAAGCATVLPAFAQWETAKLADCLEKDVWYMRQLAKKLRSGGANGYPKAKGF